MEEFNALQLLAFFFKEEKLSMLLRLPFSYLSVSAYMSMPLPGVS